MPRIDNILNWSFSYKLYSKKGEIVVNKKTSDLFEQKIIKLNKLSYSSSITRPISIENIEYVYNKFIAIAKTELNLNTFTKREISLLIEALDYCPDSNRDYKILYSSDFNFALELIQNKWRDSYILKLWDIYLRNWHLLNKKNNKGSEVALRGVIRTTCEQYNGNRPNIKNIIHNLSIFFTYDPVANYTNYLVRRNIEIENANTLINQTESILKYEFFNLVLMKYLSSIKYFELDDEKLISIYKYIKKIGSKKTSLISCSIIINKNGNNGSLANIIKNYTMELIGDPNTTINWVYSGLNELQEANIESARIKLNMWLNMHFINVFFNKLIQDDRRKDYWLEYIKDIIDIKFVGNKSNYYKLKNIESISKYVDTRYKITRRKQNTCALIIYFKDYVFIEFTDVGSLYIYGLHNFNINLNSIISMEDLKLHSWDDYAYIKSKYNGQTYLKNEGVITHRGYWEKKVDSWMKEYYYD